jgi:DNA-directed RNA polymerase subunit M/transcription elongation factor TFIIS
MNDFDRSGEFLRVRDHYRGLADLELLKLAERPSELTEVAQQALASEISCRGLRVEPVAPPAPQRIPPPPDIKDPNDPDYDEDQQLVTLRTVWSLADALQLQNLLDVAGIPFYIGPEKAPQVNAVTSNFGDGLDFQIMAIGLPWAREAMKNYAPVNDESDEDEETLDEASVRCPKCHSSEVVLEETSSEGVEGVSPERFKWTCDGCGYHWEDDGIEPG